MVAWSQLLLPALIGAVLVFFASFVIHMVMQLHSKTMKKLSNEDEVRDAINKGTPGPGMFVMPHIDDPKNANTPENIAKFEQGPVAVVWIRPSGQLKLGPFLGKWFVYTFVIAMIAGYIARATLNVGASGMEVFQVVGVACWLAYSFQGISDSIWMGKPVAATMHDLRDGLIYAALTAGAFAWMWPGA